MKFIFNVGIIFYLYSLPTFGSSILADFVSPDKSCHIIYKGTSDHGNGVFYDISSTPKKLILKEYVRIGPQINWITNSLAEIFFSEGSHGNHSYYYDCQTNAVSISYSLVIAFEPKSKLVATLLQEEIVFYKLFEKKEYFRAKVPEVGLIEYFDCDTDINFKEGNIFHIQMRCGADGDIDLKINIPK